MKKSLPSTTITTLLPHFVSNIGDLAIDRADADYDIVEESALWQSWAVDNQHAENDDLRVERAPRPAL